MRTLASVVLALGLAACGSNPGSFPITTRDASGGAPSNGAPASDAGSDLPSSTPDASTGAPPAGDAGAARSDAGDTGAAPVTRKRGLAYGSNTEADLAALSAGVGWWYNWSSSPDSTLPAGYDAHGIEFVPMVWGGSFDVTTLATQVPAGAKYLLTFNEPNFNAQSNLTPQQAAALWPQIEAFAKSKNLAIVSPALNYCGGGCNEANPFTWLDDFFAACTGCQVDYIAAHWYACTKSALQGYLSEYESKYPQPIWLTEFSCLDGSLAATDANEETYMQDAVALLESDPRVFRYSWFTGRSTATPAIAMLAADAGALTALGTSYVSLP